MKVLIVSNLDSSQPFGQFLRPFHLGRGLAEQGVDVANVGVDCSAVGFGPAWSTHRKSLRPYVGAVRQAVRSFRPDVVYGHEARGGSAAILAAVDAPKVVDFHSIPSMEWAGYARTVGGSKAGLYHLAQARSAGAERLMATRADAVIAAGQEVADDLQRLYQPRSQPTVIVNGISPSLLCAADGGSPYAAGAPAAVATIPSKDLEANSRALAFLQEVAELLTERATGIVVHVLGSSDGPPARGLRYEGFVDELLPWIVHADVCLLPYPKEAALAGGPRNKLIEYLAAGRTIVTTHEGLRGLREVADWNGVVVTDDDPGAYADAIAAAARPDAASLDARRADVHARLSWESLAGDVRDVLERSAA